MTFRSGSIIFLSEVAAVFILNYFFSISLWWLSVPVIIYKAQIIYGSAKINSNFYIKTICEGKTAEKQIAITFDDGPNPEFTPRILSTLKEYNAPATFFVIGKNIAGNEDVVRKINATGHIIGNHTYSHSFFIDFKSRSGFIDELNKTSDLIHGITGKRMKWFRPPYGVTTPNLAHAAKELNYDIIGWNVRSMDTTNDREEVILTRIKEQMKPGAIILFHDTSAKTAIVLEQTLNFAKENGFKIVSAEELLGINSTFEFESQSLDVES
jgi:peptidoglycan/xylan/chitin deacetylase (PgdA/CDA1 family)